MFTQCQRAILVSDNSCFVLLVDNYISSMENAAGYHLGPVAPSVADPGPIS